MSKRYGLVSVVLTAVVMTILVFGLGSFAAVSTEEVDGNTLVS